MKEQKPEKAIDHDEISALATQCETPCMTRLSYHGICIVLRAIGTICVICKGPIARPNFTGLQLRRSFARPCRLAERGFGSCEVVLAEKMEGVILRVNLPVKYMTPARY